MVRRSAFKPRSVCVLVHMKTTCSKLLILAMKGLPGNLVTNNGRKARFSMRDIEAVTMRDDGFLKAALAASR